MIKGLLNHDPATLDSFAESREATLRKPPSGKPANGSHAREAPESTCDYMLTELPLLTHI